MVRTGQLTASDGSDVAVSASSICVHGDSPAAVEMARRGAESLDRGGDRRAAVRDVTRHLLPCGEAAVLVELDGLDEVIALDQAVQSAITGGDSAFADVVDVVPGARTVLLVVRDGADVAPLRRALPTLTLGGSESPAGTGRGGPGTSLEIPVHYDGPDLDEVCAAHRAQPRRSWSRPTPGHRGGPRSSGSHRASPT